MDEQAEVAPVPAIQPLSAWAIVGFVLCMLIAVVAAVPATILGSFLGFAGLVTTQSDFVFMLMMMIAIGAPTVIALTALLMGIHRLAARRPFAFAYPLLGVVSMAIVYYVCGLILAS